MPLVTLYASSPLDSDAARSLLGEVSQATGKTLGKPEAYVMARIAPQTPVAFGGTFEPACLIEVKSIGSLDGDKPKRLTAVLSSLVTKSLGIPADRTYVVFTDVPARMWGHDGTTFG
jgi:phenylpyruvate tautomerase PptA (4-oxalocrotonate tautomerase family)